MQQTRLARSVRSGGGVSRGGDAGDYGFDCGGIGGGVGDEDSDGEAAAVGEDDQADVVAGWSFAGLGAGCAGLVHDDSA